MLKYKLRDVDKILFIKFDLLATSKGSPEGLNSKSRGLCESENMRVELKVVDKVR